MSATTGPTIGAGGGAPLRTRTGFAALVRRESLRVLKIWSQTIAFPTVTALLYLGVFGLALGQRIGEVAGLPYLVFVLPGIVLMQCATQSYNNNSASMFQSRSDGYIEDVLAAPLHAWQASLALLWGGLLRSLSVATLVLLVGLVVTADMPGSGVAHPLLAGVTMVSVAVLWGSIGVIAGTWAEQWDQHMLVGNLLIVPLSFVGGIFYSIDMLPQWLAQLTRLDPLFYQVQALRYAVTGTADAAPMVAVGTTVALAVAAFTLQVRLFVTGWRLRP